MEKILAGATVGISELKRDPAGTIQKAIRPLAVLNRNSVAGYILSPATWEKLVDRLEDAELLDIVQARRGGKSTAVNIDDI